MTRSIPISHYKLYNEDTLLVIISVIISRHNEFRLLHKQNFLEGIHIMQDNILANVFKSYQNEVAQLSYWTTYLDNLNSLTAVTQTKQFIHNIH